MSQSVASNVDVLIFVEDPGAANYVAQLPEALTGRGLHTRLLAAGGSAEYLSHRKIPLETVPCSATAERVLAQARPRLLIVGTSENPDTLGLALVTEARSVGIESVAVVDALVNTEHRFRGRSEAPLAYAPDWLLVPDEWTKDAYVELGYSSERAVVCGHPHYDHVRAVGARLAAIDRNALRHSLLPGAPFDRPVVVFVAEASNGLNPQQFQRSADYTLTGRGTSTGRTEIVLEEFLDAVRSVSPRPYLVLRLHPKNTEDEFSKYLDEFDLVSRGGSPLDLMHVADLVVGMTSMLLMEAALLDRPTLSVVPRGVERTWLPSVRAGVTKCATSSAELRVRLAEAFSGPIGPGAHALDCLVLRDSSGNTTDFIERLLLFCAGEKTGEESTRKW